MFQQFILFKQFIFFLPLYYYSSSPQDHYIGDRATSTSSTEDGQDGDADNVYGGQGDLNNEQFTKIVF